MPNGDRQNSIMILDHESWAKQLRMLGNFREAKLSPQTILVLDGWAAEYSGGGEHKPLEDGLSGLPPLQSIDDPAVWLPVAHLCVAVCTCSCVQLCAAYL